MKRKIREKDLRIKFDKKDMKIYKWLCLVTGVIAFFASLPVVLYGAKSMKELTNSQETLLGATLLCFPIVIVLWIGFVFKCLEGACYLKRLKRYGYVVPESKKLYENNLENLIQDRERCKEQGMQKSRVGIALTIIAGIAVLIMIYINFMETRVPHIWGILICAFLVFLYVRQISSRKFRDDVDIYGNPERKVRRNLDDGLLEIFLVFIVSLIFFVLVPDPFPMKVNPLFYRQAIRYEKRDSSSFEFFPDSLPKEAENIIIRMIYSEAKLSFYTSEKQIDEYMEIYNNSEELLDCYSSDHNRNFMKYVELCESYLNFSDEIGREDSCYLYRFKQGFIFINKNTGYVGMYCGRYMLVWD